MIYQFYLFPFGFSEQSFKQLEFQIEGYGMGVSLVKDINLTESTDINAVIIDFDQGNLDEKLSLCQEILPDRPIICLCNSPIGLDNVLTLEKPLNRNNFSLILDKLNYSGTLIQKPREIRAVYSVVDSPLHYPVKNCFQDYLVKSWKVYRRVRQPIELIFLNKPVLVIDGDEVNTFISYERLQQLCALTIHEHSISTNLLSTTPVHSWLQSEDAVSFIAKIAMWSSQGRLPDGINSTDLVRLTKPEKQHILPKIEGTQLIQEIWSHEGCSLLETEQTLQVNQVLLFSYFSALYALELVKVLPIKPSPKPKFKVKKNKDKWGWFEKKLFALKKTSIPHTL